MVVDQTCQEDRRVVEARVPLAKLFGYINDLRSLTSGRADFSMEFDHYDVAVSKK